MPQLFQVLRCYKCLVFQVHQTKKSTKWECNLCGEKQSIKRHYGLGSGKECRIHVQKLNGIRGEIDEVNESNVSADVTVEDECDNNKKQSVYSNETTIESKWSEFVEKTEEVSESGHSQNMYLKNTELVMEVPSKRRKLYGQQNFKDKSNVNQDIQDNIKNKTKVNKGINVTNELEIVATNFLETTIGLKPKPKVSNEIKRDKFVKENFHPNTVKKSSKWAQFTDTLESANEDNLSMSTKNTLQKVPNTLFSLCDDDNEIDNLLDI